MYDRINQVNTAAAMEFKTCMGILKIPDCLKFVVRDNGHYHMIVLSNTIIYSRNAYKKAIGETYPRRVASSNRNTKTAGQLDEFLHIMYLLSGSKQIMGKVGDKDEQLKMIIRDIMKLKPQAEEFSGLTEDQYDSVTLMQEDGSDELCDLSTPPGLQPIVVSLPEDNEKGLLLCKLDHGMIS